MDSFQPIEKIKTKTPTVVMLSHVRFVKDIKTAILAADLIVNVWGFKDYQLHIYGDMEKAPSYSVECQEIIAAKSLRDNVVLKGLGSPSKVLEDAWLFLNSSVSEGLPLAMGEAALTGVPVGMLYPLNAPVAFYLRITY
jgi:glycosyltransferase involved in cell wall biosynthesis